MLYNKQIFKRNFPYRGRWFYKNLLNFPEYFRDLHYLIKHGYDITAVWSTFSWFYEVMKPILTEYRDNMHGTPIVRDDCPTDVTFNSDRYMDWLELNRQDWNGIINKMIDLLDQMDENNPKYDIDDDKESFDKIGKSINVAKDEFFELFSKYYYDLWD